MQSEVENDELMSSAIGCVAVALENAQPRYVGSRGGVRRERKFTGRDIVDVIACEWSPLMVDKGKRARVTLLQMRAKRASLVEIQGLGPSGSSGEGRLADRVVLSDASLEEEKVKIVVDIGGERERGRGETVVPELEPGDDDSQLPVILYSGCFFGEKHFGGELARSSLDFDSLTAGFGFAPPVRQLSARTLMIYPIPVPSVMAWWT